MLYTDWMRHDQRDVYALIRYILFRCCKYEVVSDDEGNATRVYKPLDYMQVKWIIDRCNYLCGKWYNLCFIPYDIFNWWDDLDFIPSNFDCDWACDYKELKNGKLKKTKKKWESKEQDFWRPCCIDIANKVIRRWKLYGRFFQKIADWWWMIRRYKIKGY